MRVLGVDPGSLSTGFALVERGRDGMSCLAIGHLTPPKGQPLERRLLTIHEGLTQLFQAHRPDTMAVEDLFTGLNARSALKLGHARGVVLLAAAQAGVEVVEYAPAMVKKALVGRGRATKEQVAFMAQRLMGLAEPMTADASDALAVAICHIHRCPEIGR